MIQRTNKRRRKNNSRKNKQTETNDHETKSEISNNKKRLREETPFMCIGAHVDFLILTFLSGFLFSIFPNLEKIHFGGFGKKTPEPYQFSTHKYTQPNMLGNFFSFSFPSFFLFSILPKIYSTKHIFSFFFTMILFVYEILPPSHFFCPLFYFEISQNIVLFLK